MKIIKNAARKAISALGFELRRQTDPLVRYDNFANLVSVYEHSLNKEGQRIPSNEMRIKLMARLLGTPPSEAYFIVRALSKCCTVPGDVCEFGVAQGETSALIANEMIEWGDKRLHLFDSFEGLPKPSKKDELKDDIFSLGSIESYTGRMSFREDIVRHRLNAIGFPASRYRLHKGFIEQTIQRNVDLPESVCFAYVDFDFYEPIMTALEFLHGRTRDGATIVVDDYDFFSTGAKTAVDEFVATQNSKGVIYECVVPNPVYGYFAILTKVSA